MNKLTLRQLRYIDAIARHGHFGRAAADCAVTQPALSMQIKDMENALGIAVVERTARRVRLTQFGESAMPGIRAVLRAVEDLEDLARASRDRLTGIFRLGMIPTIAPYLLPATIRRLTGAYPDLDIHVREAMTSKLIEELTEGRLDAAVVALPVSEPSLAEVPLFEENFVLVRPLKDKGLPIPSRKMLREMRLLLLEEGHCFRDQALAFCNMPKTRPVEALAANSLSTLVQMVSAGLGITLIPEMAVAVETRSAAVSVARLGSPKPSRTVGMIWRKSNPLAAQIRHMAEAVKSAAAPIPPPESPHR